MENKVSAVRRIQFCSGHRVHLHESKCRNMHGHNYIAFIHARGIKDPIDNIGRVIDFSVLKEKVGGWIEEYWDHGFIFYQKDEQMLNAFSFDPDEQEYGIVHTHKSFALPYNPTAENMAKFLCDEICPDVLEGTGVEVFKIVLWETENCYAEYEKNAN